MTDIADRFPENPILRPDDIRPSMAGMQIECLLNPGAFRFEGKIWLLVRVAERPEQQAGKITFPIIGGGATPQIVEFDTADPLLDTSDPRMITYAGQYYLTTMSHLRLMVSDDGVHFCEPSGYRPIFGQGELEVFGIEDCRVTQIGDTYYLTYSQASPHGVGVGLRSTRDWRDIRHHGMIFTTQNKDCAIFDEKIGGRYYALHRPSSPTFGGHYMWIAESPDLVHWGNHRCLAHSRAGSWDAARIGAGAAPIRTQHGWLEIYHGATDNPTRYCLGALLLDLDQPWKVLARSRDPIMEPLAECEKTGFFGNVVFTNGHVVDGDMLTIYYGASDSVICGAQFSIEEIIGTLAGT